MNIILLSGGSGKRLWPLSNDIRSKQFIRIFRTADGSYESMLQRVYRQIRGSDPAATVTIATARSQVSAIRGQLGEDVRISVEPCRRDTFPAIALATAYLNHVQGIAPEEPVVVCPVDPYVEDGYFTMLRRLSEQAARDEARLVLLGIEPTLPSEKYGYILPRTADEVSEVEMFREKPDRATAEGYIARGGLWNGGVFAYRLSYVLEKARELLGSDDYRTLFDRYGELPKISFDYAVAEKEPRIRVIRYRGEWKDVGTWNTLTDVMSENIIGSAVVDDTCENVHIVNELDLPILAMGLKGVVISAGPEGILVAEKHRSAHMKPYVESIAQEVRFAEKSWGEYKVLNVSRSCLTAQITVRAGRSMSYHSHDSRDEVWTVAEGTGWAVVDGMRQRVAPGSVLALNAGCRHTLRAETDLKVIEVQLGEEISADDKHKFDLET